MNLESKPKFIASKPTRKTIADLYPQLSAEEQAVADDNLKRYVALVWRIFQRLQREKKDKI